MATLIDMTKKLKRLWAKRPTKFVALDLDHRYLRVVYAEAHRHEPRYGKLAAVAVPDGLDLSDPQAVGQFIGQSLRDLGLHGRAVLMDVPRSQAILKTISLPAGVTDRELPGMVRYQVERELPFGVDDAVIDFTVETHYNVAAIGTAAGRNGGSGSTTGEAASQGDDVLVAAVRRGVVEHYQRIAEAADVWLYELGLRPYADIRTLEACVPVHECKRNVALLHLTADEAEINVLINGVLVFSRSAALKTIGVHEGVTVTREDVIESVVVEVVRSLQSVRAVQQEMKIERIWVAGDPTIKSEVASALTERSRVECRTLHAVNMLNIDTDADPRDGFITAIGLSIGHCSVRGAPLDFLHPKEPPVERDERRIRMMMGGAAAAVVVAAALAWGVADLRASSRHLEEARKEFNALEKQSRPVKQLAQRVEALQAWQNGDHAWLDHWANLTALFPPATDAYITSLRTNPDQSISFVIKARSSTVITELTQRLREANYEVKLGAESTSNDRQGYQYSTTVRLGMPSAYSIEVAKLKAPPRLEDDVYASPNSGPPPRGNRGFTAPLSNPQEAPATGSTPTTPAGNTLTAEPSRPQPQPPNPTDNNSRNDDRSGDDRRNRGRGGGR